MEYFNTKLSYYFQILIFPLEWLFQNFTFFFLVVNIVAGSPFFDSTNIEKSNHIVRVHNQVMLQCFYLFCIILYKHYAVGAITTFQTKCRNHLHVKTINLVLKY